MSESIESVEDLKVAHLGYSRWSASLNAARSFIERGQKRNEAILPQAKGGGVLSEGSRKRVAHFHERTEDSGAFVPHILELCALVRALLAGERNW